MQYKLITKAVILIIIPSNLTLYVVWTITAKSNTLTYLKSNINMFLMCVEPLDVTKQIHATVAVQPVAFRVTSQQLLAPSVRTVTCQTIRVTMG